MWALILSRTKRRLDQANPQFRKRLDFWCLKRSIVLKQLSTKVLVMYSNFGDLNDSLMSGWENNSLHKRGWSFLKRPRWQKKISKYHHYIRSQWGAQWNREKWDGTSDPLVFFGASSLWFRKVYKFPMKIVGKPLNITSLAFEVGKVPYKEVSKWFDKVEWP